MTTLTELLANADGEEAILDCWGRKPEFATTHLLRAELAAVPIGTRDVVLVVLAMTADSEDPVHCFPSEIQFRCEAVDWWAYRCAFGPPIDEHENESPALSGWLLVECGGYTIRCRRLRVLRCTRSPLFSQGPQARELSHPPGEGR